MKSNSPKSPSTWTTSKSVNNAAVSPMSTIQALPDSNTGGNWNANIRTATSGRATYIDALNRKVFNLFKRIKYTNKYEIQHTFALK